MRDQKCNFFNRTDRVTKPNGWITWYPSREDVVMLNVDSGCLGDSGRTCFDGLLRNGDIEILTAIQTL